MKQRIAIPLINNSLSDHFGQAEEFLIVDILDEKILKQDIHTPPPHQPGIFPTWLHQQGVTDVLAEGIGQRAIELFHKKQIKVHDGVIPKKPEDLINDFLEDKLQTGINLCDH